MKLDYVRHLKARMTQAEIDEALMLKMDADEKEIKRLREERDDMLAALKYACSVFDCYITHHLEKRPPDYDKAAGNERHRAIIASVIDRVEPPAG